MFYRPDRRKFQEIRQRETHRFLTTVPELSDKSNRDFVTKTLAIFQSSWFIIQCIAHGAQGLFLTQLELAALALRNQRRWISNFWKKSKSGEDADELERPGSPVTGTCVPEVEWHTEGWNFENWRLLGKSSMLCASEISNFLGTLAITLMFFFRWCLHLSIYLVYLVEFQRVAHYNQSFVPLHHIIFTWFFTLSSIFTFLHRLPHSCNQQDGTSILWCLRDGCSRNTLRRFHALILHHLRRSTSLTITLVVDFILSIRRDQQMSQCLQRLCIWSRLCPQ